MNALDSLIKSIYASFVPTKEQQLAAGKRLQGASFDARPDANHPLQQWAKKISDSILGPETSNANTVTPPGQTVDRWQTYVPVVLLALAVILIFNE
jgi:hypothetical protein